MNAVSNQSNLNEAYKDVNDIQLLKLISNQEIPAYEALYDRYASQTYGTIRRIVQNSAIADRLLQETFWQIWHSAPTYQEHGTASAWIFRIARNRSMDELRQQKVQPQNNGQIAPTTVTGNAGQNQSDTDVEAELRLGQEKAQLAMGQVPREQQVCLLLAYFEGLTHNEIAEKTGLSLGVVKNRMRVGTEKLEHLLRAEGYP